MLQGSRHGGMFDAILDLMNGVYSVANETLRQVKGERDIDEVSKARCS